VSDSQKRELFKLTLKRGDDGNPRSSQHEEDLQEI
jgi:hypothetical protein